MTKWGGRPHWEYDGVFLGSDEHGEWLGCPAGTFYSRPGLEFHADVDSVTLVPRDQAWCATFHAPGIRFDVYVDVTMPPTWDGRVLRAVDLDLDVIRRSDGSVYLDDADEFAEHRALYGYPDDVVAMAEASAASVLAAVEAGVPPYDGSAERWLAALVELA